LQPSSTKRYRRSEEPNVSGIPLNWIDGEWLTVATVCPARNPASGDVVGQFADGSQGKADAAVGATRRALRTTICARDRALRHRVHRPARLTDR
jgi:acyl-CoA reductase-like NAD-dependent aldehyde dehydrogenase